MSFRLVTKNGGSNYKERERRNVAPQIPQRTSLKAVLFIVHKEVMYSEKNKVYLLPVRLRKNVIVKLFLLSAFDFLEMSFSSSVSFAENLLQRNNINSTKVSLPVLCIAC